MADAGKLASKVIGSLIIIGSMTLKIPIIQNCVAARSTEGLAESSLIFEIISLTIHVCNNLRGGIPISVWGELLSILIQNFVIIGCVWYYGKKPALAALTNVGTYIFTILTLMVLLPRSLLFLLPLMGMAMSWSAYIPQIMSNYQNGHTGPLALQTQIQSTFGSYLRLFTVFAEVDDFLVLFATVAGCIFQTIILTQIIMYKENTKRVMARINNPSSEVVEEEEQEEEAEDDEEVNNENAVVSEIKSKLLQSVEPAFDQLKSTEVYQLLSNFANETQTLATQTKGDILQSYSEFMDSDILKRSLDTIGTARSEIQPILVNLMQPVEPFLTSLNEKTFDEYVDSAYEELETISEERILPQVDLFRSQIEKEMRKLKKLKIN